LKGTGKKHMMKKWFEYLYSHGMVVMIIGFIISIVSLLVYMQTRYLGSAVPQVAFICTIVGFVVYLVGRVFVAKGRHRPGAVESAVSDAKDEL